MSQFVVYENPNRDSRKAYPLLLDIQSNLIDDLRSTIVVPLVPKKAVGEVISRLTPVIRIEGLDYVMLTQQISGALRSDLGKAVADLSAERFAIIAAIDFVISGI